MQMTDSVFICRREFKRQKPLPLRSKQEEQEKEEGKGNEELGGKGRDGKGEEEEKEGEEYIATGPWTRSSVLSANGPLKKAASNTAAGNGGMT